MHHIGWHQITPLIIPGCLQEKHLQDLPDFCIQLSFRRIQNGRRTLAGSLRHLHSILIVSVHKIRQRPCPCFNKLPVYCRHRELPPHFQCIAV